MNCIGRSSRVWLLGLALAAILPGSTAVAATSGGWNNLGSDPGGKVQVVERVGNIVYFGGQFENAGGIPQADKIARWNGNAWSAVGPGLGSNNSATVYSIAVDQQTGRVFAGGSFQNVGPNVVDGLAYWNGNAWRSVGGASFGSNVTALEIVGRTMYVGGGFADAANIEEADFIAAVNLDTFAWSAITDLGGEFGGTVSDIEADGAGSVFVSGTFQNVDGIPQADNIVHYDGGKQWSALGSGPAPLHGAIQGGLVRGMAVDGSTVYAVGDFINAGGINAADRIARWNGSAWSAVGTPSFFGEAGLVPLYDVAVDGPRVFVVGTFGNAGGLPKADGVAAYSGGAWRAVGTVVSGPNSPAPASLYDLAVVGSRLYVGGLQTLIGGGPKANFAAFYRLRQPDAQIRTGSTGFAGNGVYNTTGANQTRSQSVNQGATGVFEIRITNDGLHADEFTVEGPGSGNGFTARYFAGSTNITSQVVAGTYQTTLGPDASRTITLRVSVGNGVGNGARRSWLVKATSSGTGAPKDAVKATVVAS